MGLGNLLKAVVKTVTLPIDIACDTVTLFDPTEPSRTAAKIDDVADELNNIFK